MAAILIAEDYTDQYEALIADISKIESNCSVCKNTIQELSLILAGKGPDILLLNAGKIGLEDTEKLISMLETNLGETVPINICPYDDPWLFQVLSSMGIKRSYYLPSKERLLMEQLKELVKGVKKDTNEKKAAASEKLRKLLDRLNPSTRQRGSAYIHDAVMMILFGDLQRINLHGDIYTRIADKYSTSVKSVEHSIRIAVENCWSKGDKGLLDAVTQSTRAEKRPTNQEFILCLVRAVDSDLFDSGSLGKSHTMNNTGSKLHI